MMLAPRGSRMERAVAAETLAAALSPLSVRAIQQRLERILLDDRELLISLPIQAEAIDLDVLRFE